VYYKSNGLQKKIGFENGKLIDLRPRIRDIEKVDTREF
jgi:hypothetical protein